MAKPSPFFVCSLFPCIISHPIAICVFTTLHRTQLTKSLVPICFSHCHRNAKPVHILFIGLPHHTGQRRFGGSLWRLSASNKRHTHYGRHVSAGRWVATGTSRNSTHTNLISCSSTALFALFTLMIIHFKRQQGRPMLDSDYDGTVDGIVARPGGVAIVAKPLLGARVFLTSWSLDLGWGGVVLCAITSVLWILLSKIMRYNPFSALMI